MPTKITKEKARENSLDVLEGRAYVAELIEKRIPSSTWTKCNRDSFFTSAHRYVGKMGKLKIFIEKNEEADIYRNGLFGDTFLLSVQLAEGSYEKAASKAGYLKEVVTVLFALEGQ